MANDAQPDQSSLLERFGQDRVGGLLSCLRGAGGHLKAGLERWVCVIIVNACCR